MAWSEDYLESLLFRFDAGNLIGRSPWSYPALLLTKAEIYAILYVAEAVRLRWDLSVYAGLP